MNSHELTEEFAYRKVLAVKKRTQIVVMYQEIEGPDDASSPVHKECVVHSADTDLEFE